MRFKELSFTFREWATIRFIPFDYKHSVSS